MIRVLLGAGSAAAANGITADVDLLLDAGAAGSAGDDFTVDTTIDAGAATGECVSAGLDELVVSSIAGGEVTAGVETAGADETVTVTFSSGQAPSSGLNADVGVSLVAGDATGDLALPAIGDAFEGGFYAGLISHTADGVATHALIVAPRATGATGTGYPVTTNLRARTTNTFNAGMVSPFDGAANTANALSSYPAAQFCIALNINGFTDWYLPARYELDIAYENLKPTTTNNFTTDGINPYSVPQRNSNRTTTVPGQTSSSLFATGGEEHFADGQLWSSTDSGDGLAWRVVFSNGGHTQQLKTSFSAVRAFRRIAL
jgi:hypothetical protein